VDVFVNPYLEAGRFKLIISFEKDPPYPYLEVSEEIAGDPEKLEDVIKRAEEKLAGTGRK